MEYVAAVVGGLAGAGLGWFASDAVARVREGEMLRDRLPGRAVLSGVAAVVCGLLGWAVGPHPWLPAYLYLGVIGVVLGFLDVALHRLPDPLVLPSYPVFGGLLVGGAVVGGVPGDLGRAALGGLAMFALYGVLHLLSPAGMGFGDVKLAGLLGAGLAFLSWEVLMAGTFAGFLAGGVWSLGLLLSRRGGAGTAIPYGPFILVGALIGVVWTNLAAALG